MFFTDPVRFNIPLYVLLIGIIVGTLGLFIMILSMRARKNAGKGNLITTGIYSKFRHPMYMGMSLIMIGYPIATGSCFTLLSAVLWVSQMIIWGDWEEKELSEQFGQEYLDYKNRTFF